MCFLRCRDLQYAAVGGIELLFQCKVESCDWLWISSCGWWLSGWTKKRNGGYAMRESEGLCWLLGAKEFWLGWNHGQFSGIMDYSTWWWTWMWLAKDNNLGYRWTGWTVRRNCMAVQMPNLGILESWNFRSLNNYWNPYWDIRVTESLDYGSFTAVVAAFATSTLLEICYGWTCKPGGLPPGGCICDIQNLADNQQTIIEDY